MIVKIAEGKECIEFRSNIYKYALKAVNNNEVTFEVSPKTPVSDFLSGFQMNDWFQILAPLKFVIQLVVKSNGFVIHPIMITIGQNCFEFATIV